MGIGSEILDQYLLEPRHALLALALAPRTPRIQRALAPFVCRTHLDRRTKRNSAHLIVTQQQVTGREQTFASQPMPYL
jgi:hypothetical protein